MSSVDLESSVPDWLIEHPELLTLFQELGIDYSCGGKSLRTACEQRDITPCDVARAIAQRLAKVSPGLRPAADGS